MGHQFFLVVYRKFAYWFQRAGAVFPQRTESSAPVFTPPQTQPLSSYPQNVRSAEFREEAAESSAEAEFPTLRYVLSPRFCLKIKANHPHPMSVYLTAPNFQPTRTWQVRASF